MLEEANADFEIIEYLKTPLDRDTVAHLIELVPNDPADLVRKDSNFKELGLDAADYTTADAVLELLLEHPKLMQRPILVRGDKAVIGRPEELVLGLLD